MLKIFSRMYDLVPSSPVEALELRSKNKDHNKIRNVSTSTKSEPEKDVGFQPHLKPRNLLNRDKSLLEQLEEVD